MRLLEISNGLSINLDEIQVIERYSDFVSKVIVGGESYTTDIPYNSLISLITARGKAEENAIRTSVERIASFQTRPTP